MMKKEISFFGGVDSMPTKSIDQMPKDVPYSNPKSKTQPAFTNRDRLSQVPVRGGMYPVDDTTPKYGDPQQPVNIITGYADGGGYLAPVKDNGIPNGGFGPPRMPPIEDVPQPVEQPPIFVPPKLPPIEYGTAGDNTQMFADLFSNTFSGGLASTPQEDLGGGSTALLYPVTYDAGRPAEASSKSPNPIIWLVLAGLLLVGFFVYKKFIKKGG